jgi:glycosyltransferase involved in cell wall biosynthesis
MSLNRSCSLNMNRHNNMSTLVSVIIPTYNRAATIERAINSVLAQTWRPVEIIVVDSRSKDNTVELLKQYGDKVQLISQEKNGPGAARNAGIQAARGEIISFLDSDDEWLPEKTERQVKLLQATESAGVKCCVCNARMEYVNGPLMSFALADLRPELKEGVWTNPAEVLITRFLFFNQVAAVRREALEQSGYFRSGLMEDYDLALRLSLLGPWAFIADPLVVWHEQPGDNLSQTHSQLEICERTFEILKETGSSAQFGPLVPDVLLRSRLRFLGSRIDALRLSRLSSPVARLAGRFRLRCLRGWERLYWRLPSTPRMNIRAV